MTREVTSAATSVCEVARVRRRFQRLLDAGVEVRPAGRARVDPGVLFPRYLPRCAVELFDATWYLSGYRYDDSVGFFAGFLVLGERSSTEVEAIYPRIFYKDSSLMWRVATHFISDRAGVWLGKGDVRRERVGEYEYVCSMESTANLPFEVQKAFDRCSRAVRRRRDDDAIPLFVRQAPPRRVEPYADFTAPRRAEGSRIHGGRRIARFTRPGDPDSLRFSSGFAPDFERGVLDRWETESVFFGGRLRKFRIVSENRKVQYLFFASPTHAWLNPPQALTPELSTYGVRLVDVDADDDLFVPGYEYHDHWEGGVFQPSQIPEGYAGERHPEDPGRADASAWLEALPVIREFRHRVLARSPS